MADQWASAPELHGELSHAEAVAARLVEVICDLDWQLGDDRVICDALIVQLQHERAEVAALREQIAAEVEARGAAIRAEASDYDNEEDLLALAAGHMLAARHIRGEDS